MSSENKKLLVTIDNWETISKFCYPIREKVFVEEQNVPVEEELDEYDPTCVHILISAIEGEEDAESSPTKIPAATGRLVILSDQETGKIGRMAVLKQFRGCNVGRLLLKTIIEHAKKMGLKKLVLSSQQHATKFYEKEGFVVNSDVFMDCDIPHLSMFRDL